MIPTSKISNVERLESQNPAGTRSCPSHRFQQHCCMGEVMAPRTHHPRLGPIRNHQFEITIPQRKNAFLTNQSAEPQASLGFHCQHWSGQAVLALGPGSNELESGKRGDEHIHGDTTWVGISHERYLLIPFVWSLCLICKNRCVYKSRLPTFNPGWPDFCSKS